MPVHDLAALPYRPCVGIMLLNREGHVFVGRRPDVADPNVADAEGRGEWWQMPQGGIDAGEDPQLAAMRELYEETGVRSATAIGQSSSWYTYDLPPHLLGVSWGGRFRGQRQLWFAMRFTGADSEVNLAPPGHTAEFDKWQWVPIDDLLGLIVQFKRGVYEQVVAEFKRLAVAG